MKVCVISPGVVHAIPRTKAIAPYFDEIHFIDMCGGKNNMFDELDNVIVHLPFANGEKTRGGLTLLELLRDINPDGIVCHFASGIHLFISLLYGECPVAAIGMGQDVLYDKGDSYIPPILRLLIRMSIRRTEFVSAKSIFLAKRIEHYGYKKRLDVNYWGANLSAFAKMDKVDSRRQLSLPEGAPVILSPRAVEPRLNIDLIIESIVEITKHHPDAVLVVLGRFSEEYRNKIECLITDKHLTSSVRLIYEVGQDLLPLYYSASDVVVSMASSEGFPNTLLEVMACEVPIVAGRIPQIEELLVDAESARLCAINADEIAIAVTNVLTNPERYKMVADRAKEIVEMKGDIAVNGARFSTILQDIIRSHGKQKRPLINRLPLLLIYIGHLVRNKFSCL